MRKSLLAVLLVAALVLPVVPAFAADEGTMELDIKAGFNVMSKLDVDKMKDIDDMDPAFTAGVDFFYYVMPELAVGAGIQNVFNAKIKDSDDKAGFVNLYAQAKYVFETGNDVFNNVYPLLQIGYGILSVDSDFVDTDSNGIYWGIGVGTTIKENFVFELLYSMNNATVKDKGLGKITSDVKYSTLQLKVGYKFVF